MSGVLLFDVNEAANAFSQAWFIDMKQILDDSIDQLSRIPFCPDHVKIAINGIIGSTVQSVKKTIYPVVHVTNYDSISLGSKASIHCHHCYFNFRCSSTLPLKEDVGRIN